MNPDDTPPPSVIPKYTLPGYVWLAWFPCAALVAWLSWGSRTHPEDPAHSIGYIIGAVVSSLLLPMVLSWIVWRLTRRQGPGHIIVFLIVLGLVVLGQVNLRLDDRRKVAEAGAEMNRVAQEEKVKMRAALDGDGNGKLSTEAAGRVIDHATDTLQKVADTTHGAARAEALGGQAFLQRVQAYQQRYARAVDQLHVDTFFAMESVATAELRATRQAALVEFQAACADLRKFVEHGPQMFEAELRKHDVAESTVRDSVAGYRAQTDPRLPLMLGIREKDEELAREMAAFLRFGEKYEGHWSTNPQTGAVQLPDDEAATAFNDLLARVRKIGEDQVAMQKQLLSAK